MIVIGELINSTRKKIKEAMENKDADYIRNLAKQQDEAGADFIDVNAGAFIEDELEKLKWAMEEVQAVTSKPLAIDSPRGKAIEMGLGLHKNGKPMINSITKESERWDELFPLVVESDSFILSLCIDNNGIPDIADERVKIAEGIINDLTKAGKPIEDIGIDPLTTPLSVNTNYGLVVTETIEKIKKNFPEAKLITGLSNISYGLPARRQVNRAFITMCMVYGLDGALIDPLDRVMMSIVRATEALLNKDPFCGNYLKDYRQGLIAKE
ncbi:MAG: dihydropteroate synthase [Spirochaetota bacterium]|nr:MAG: dihydropteroate synthase [Spirochaetota bacterium]